MHQWKSSKLWRSEDEEDRKGQEREGKEEKEASESPPIDEASNLRVYNNPLLTQMQTNQNILIEMRL